MIEIIEEGKVQYFTVTCIECNSKLKFSRADENVCYTTDRMSYPIEEELYITCPVCKMKIKTGEKHGDYIARCMDVNKYKEQLYENSN